jgi:hypothetical protein
MSVRGALSRFRDTCWCMHPTNQADEGAHRTSKMAIGAHRWPPPEGGHLWAPMAIFERGGRRRTIDRSREPARSGATYPANTMNIPYTHEPSPAARATPCVPRATRRPGRRPGARERRRKRSRFGRDEGYCGRWRSTLPPPSSPFRASRARGRARSSPSPDDVRSQGPLRCDQAIARRRRFFHRHPPASDPRAIRPRTAELGSGTAESAPNRPLLAPGRPATK